ncbi:hypothetical protein CROQUDRAFT_714606 [Cronartium quercuum f. sp. fusiforme G11]|uniref:Uncharacterized protein n=1 Tax=Cronartium quercuum f. sp. fusiforme G11 TaxID=708437 RepID=A0A9P6NLV7_9BASI|nr:hypothetical protein CROQUDRAFT_714606 [Cronartium quercuum f. sp. fusiforme G11]
MLLRKLCFDLCRQMGSCILAAIVLASLAQSMHVRPQLELETNFPYAYDSTVLQEPSSSKSLDFGALEEALVPHQDQRINSLTQIRTTLDSQEPAEAFGVAFLTQFEKPLNIALERRPPLERSAQPKINASKVPYRSFEPGAHSTNYEHPTGTSENHENGRNKFRKTSDTTRKWPYGLSAQKDEISLMQETFTVPQLVGHVPQQNADYAPGMKRSPQKFDFFPAFPIEKTHPSFEDSLVEDMHPILHPRQKHLDSLLGDFDQINNSNLIKTWKLLILETWKTLDSCWTKVPSSLSEHLSFISSLESAGDTESMNKVLKRREIIAPWISTIRYLAGMKDKVAHGGAVAVSLLNIVDKRLIENNQEGKQKFWTLLFYCQSYMIHSGNNRLIPSNPSDHLIEDTRAVANYLWKIFVNSEWNHDPTIPRFSPTTIIENLIKIYIQKPDPLDKMAESLGILIAERVISQKKLTKYPKVEPGFELLVKKPQPQMLPNHMNHQSFSNDNPLEVFGSNIAAPIPPHLFEIATAGTRPHMHDVNPAETTKYKQDTSFETSSRNPNGFASVTSGLANPSFYPQEISPADMIGSYNLNNIVYHPLRESQGHEHLGMMPQVPAPATKKPIVGGPFHILESEDPQRTTGN